MSDYLYDQAWERERERLAGIEATWDPGTVRHLEALGMGEGWRCLEVGAGGGSIADWLCRRVGERGRVVATDLDTRFVERLDHPNLEVRKHDIVGDSLEEGAFDLVYSRLLLEHLSGRDDALKKMAAALVPGGWLLVEDFDWAAAGTIPDDPLFTKVTDAVLGLMAKMGYRRDYGRLLPGAFRAAGLEDVDAEGRVRIFQTNHPGSDFYRLSLEQVRGPVVGAGAVTDAEIDAALARMSDPENGTVTPVLVACWGRKRSIKW